MVKEGSEALRMSPNGSDLVAGVGSTYRKGKLIERRELRLGVEAVGVAVPESEGVSQGPKESGSWSLFFLLLGLGSVGLVHFPPSPLKKKHPSAQPSFQCNNCPCQYMHVCIR